MWVRVQKSWTRRALLLAALVHIIEEKHHEDLIQGYVIKTKVSDFLYKTDKISNYCTAIICPNIDEIQIYIIFYCLIIIVLFG
jgi:hypothetical protein